MNFASYLDKFLVSRNPIGCSDEEIKSLERMHSVVFPEDYVVFLRKAGRGAKGLWGGSDYQFFLKTSTREISLHALQEWAKETLRDDGVADILPSGAFVIHMHQGYQFYILSSDGVYFYQEGRKSLERAYPSFAEFFKATAST